MSFLLALSECSYVYFTYSVQSFYLYLAGEAGEVEVLTMTLYVHSFSIYFAFIIFLLLFHRRIAL